MGPYAQDTLAGILGMKAEEERQKAAMAAPLGMQPQIQTTASPGFVGINGEGMTGKELPGLEGLSQVPAHDTLMAAAQAGDGGMLGTGQGAAQQNPMAAMLGMEALKMLAAPPQQQQLPTLSTGAAPRGQQVNVKGTMRERADVAPPKRSMSGVLYGGK